METNFFNVKIDEKLYIEKDIESVGEMDDLTKLKKNKNSRN